MKMVRWNENKALENATKRLLSNHAFIWRGKSGSIGEKVVAKREFNNPMDKHALKVVKDDETVGHLPREFSRIAWYFLARSGEISVEVIGRRQHCKQLCGGMEIPCQLEFNCSNKAQMKRLKELLASKIQV